MSAYPGDPFGTEYRVRVQGYENRFRNPKTGAQWIEEPIDGNPDHVMCTYIESGIRTAGGAYPAMLSPNPSMMTSQATPAAPPAAKPEPKKLEPIRRQTGNAGVDVVFHPEAVSELRRGIFIDTLAETKPRETGSWLTGAWDGQRVHIVGARPAATSRTRTSMRLSWSELSALELSEMYGRGFGLIGSAHTHPSGSLRASETDFQSSEDNWSYANEGRGSWTPYVVNLILTGRGVVDLEGMCWVTTKKDGRFVTEPTEITLL